MNIEYLEDIQAHLAVCRTMSLATVDGAGRPHAANVWYVSVVDLRLHWFSDPAKAHSRHLVDRPDAAATIYQEVERFDQIRGLQLHGIVTRHAPDSEAYNEAFRLYLAKYPFVDTVIFRALLKRETFYCFMPTWLRWIDNRRGFGFKVEQEMTRSKG